MRSPGPRPWPGSPHTRGPPESCKLAGRTAGPGRESLARRFLLQHPPDAGCARSGHHDLPAAFHDKGTVVNPGAPGGPPYGPHGPAWAGALPHLSVPSAHLPGLGLGRPGISISMKSRKQCQLCGEMKVRRRVRLKSPKGGAGESKGQMGGDKAR